MNKSFSKISVIGLGYVGLPLSLQFARSGVKVLGLDLDPQKVDAINAGKGQVAMQKDEQPAAEQAAPAEAAPESTEG